MNTAMLYIVAALAEIAGCFAFWMWHRNNAPAWVLLPGLAALTLFAWVLARVDSGAAGRTFAAYGGVYIIASLAWLWAVEGVRPDWRDLAGATLCIVGAIVIFAGRGSPQAH